MSKDQVLHVLQQEEQQDDDDGPGIPGVQCQQQ